MAKSKASRAKLKAVLKAIPKITSKTSEKIPAGANGSNLMRLNGYALLQLWVPPALKNAYVRRAVAKKKPMTHWMRRALVREANSWGVNSCRFDELTAKSTQSVVKRNGAVEAKEVDEVVEAEAEVAKTSKTNIAGR